MQEELSRADKAARIFAQGYNCAQAVFGAFAEDFGMDFATAMRVSASLGGGLGHSGEVCGAALGMCLVNGAAKERLEPQKEAKNTHNARTKALMTAFSEAFGHTGCDELSVHGDRLVCVNYVRWAAERVEKEIADKQYYTVRILTGS